VNKAGFFIGIAVVLYVAFIVAVPIKTSSFTPPRDISNVVPGDPVINIDTYEITAIMATNPIENSVGLLNGDRMLYPEFQTRWKSLHEGVSNRDGWYIVDTVRRIVLAGKKMLRLPI